MLTQIRFPTITFFIRCLLFAFILQFSLAGVTQARALYSMAQRVNNCQTTMQSGWRPYRVQAVDTLDTLVAHTSVSLEQVMQVNCLSSTLIEAGDLLLLPALAQVTTAAPTTAQQPNQTLAATGETAPAAATTTMITVISTTETLATGAAAEAVTSNAATPITLPALTSPITPANLIVMALFVLVGLGIFFFALRPRDDDAPLVRTLFNTAGNAIFLFAGVLLGVILFPMLRVPSFTELPTSVSASIVVSLISLLVAKELFFTGHQWRTMNRLLNLGIAPLLMIFFLNVATRVVEMVN